MYRPLCIFFLRLSSSPSTRLPPPWSFFSRAKVISLRLLIYNISAWDLRLLKIPRNPNSMIQTSFFLSPRYQSVRFYVIWSRCFVFKNRSASYVQCGWVYRFVLHFILWPWLYTLGLFSLQSNMSQVMGEIMNIAFDILNVFGKIWGGFLTI